MENSVWLEVAALILGPVSAVAITLWIEGERRQRESRLTVLRLLMATRHLPADPSYSTAVNLVPVEFNDEAAVMTAYKEYQEAIRQRPDPNDQEAVRLCEQIMGTKQTKMIYAIMRALKLKASEADLPVEAYAAKGFIERDNLYLASLHAQLRIATALERSIDQP
jgi:hypothetical protein